MSSKIVILFAVLVIGLAIAQSDENDGACGPHAKWKSCGSLCAPTCASHRRGGLCPAVCVAGCFCEKGYLKEDDGTCVKECKPRNRFLKP